VLRYCYQLWQQVSHCYGQVEAGQVLGYHFSEAAQVVNSVAFLQLQRCKSLVQINSPQFCNAVVVVNLPAVQLVSCNPLQLPASVVVPLCLRLPVGDELWQHREHGAKTIKEPAVLQRG